jgi:predicted glutamine amidotransferase
MQRPVRTRLAKWLVLWLSVGGFAAVDAHACRFWALVGSDYPRDLIADHLRDSPYMTLRQLGGMNADGWGFASFLPESIAVTLNGPIIRRGGPPANHATDPDYGLAVSEMSSLRPKAAIGHVRAGTSGHFGVPNPHPFQHDGLVFAHNGGMPEQSMVGMLTEGDPQCLNDHPPDYKNGYIDSELYFLYLLKYLRQHPSLGRAEALRRAVWQVDSTVPNCRLNFVLTDGDTLYALRCAPYDESDAVRFMPQSDSRQPQVSPYWAVASQPVGSHMNQWGTIPARSLAVFVPGRAPQFLPVNGDTTAPPLDWPKLQVSPAQPNPMRGGVEVPIQVPAGGAQVTLEIWDPQGRLVWRDGPQVFDAGERRIHWNARDRDGAEVPSGSYFCRVRVGARTWEQRVAVVR